MHRLLVAATSASLLLVLAASASAIAASATTARQTSRWGTLDCSEAPVAASARPTPCRLIVRIRGQIGPDRLRLVRATLRRCDDARRALHRDVALHVEVDSEGGEMFAAMEIGRLLRAADASIAVERGAVCNSSCVFVLMGATRRSVARGARVGIHRPSLGEGGRGTDVNALADQIGWFAKQMDVSPAIASAIMAVPSDRMRFLNVAELDAFGIRVSSESGAQRSK
jgi:ATP-dependent protease ClpP protease subunit